MKTGWFQCKFNFQKQIYLTAFTLTRPYNPILVSLRIRKRRHDSVYSSTSSFLIAFPLLDTARATGMQNKMRVFICVCDNGYFILKTMEDSFFHISHFVLWSENKGLLRFDNNNNSVQEQDNLKLCSHYRRVYSRDGYPSMDAAWLQPG